jgi:UDP-2,3-diacylglucosamine hydrolase
LVDSLPAGAATPAPAELVLDPAWVTVEFVSDLHLSEDLPATTAAFERWLDGTRADAVFILGDLFEVWVGDDAATRPYEARCVAALSCAAARRPVWVMHGNRDFLLGPGFFAATGTRPLADPTVVEAFGRRVLLTHGDAWCLDDKPYMQFRAQVRQPALAAALLAQPLEARLALAAKMRAGSQENQRGAVTYADVDEPTARAAMAAGRADTLVHGHTHRPGTAPFAGGTRLVLSDWHLDPDAEGHAGHGAPRAEVLRWTASGFERVPVRTDAGAAAG